MSLNQIEGLFNRHAKIADGKYISVERVRQLLGRGAVQYAKNAVKGYRRFADYWNIYGTVEVFTFEGFYLAFRYFSIMEVKNGKYNAWQSVDYLSRPEFA